MASEFEPERIFDRRALLRDSDAIAREQTSETLRRGALLALLRRALAQGRTEIRRRFESDGDGPACVAAASYLVDQIIRLSGDFAADNVFPVASPTEGEEIAIVAVGGYGRAEIAPHSDVDVIFLAPRESPRGEQLIEFVLYMLWDLGLRIGHSAHSVESLLRLAKTDHRVRTSVLESRFVWGQHRHFVSLRQRFAAEIVPETARAFVEAKLSERDERHQRMGDSRYVMEPNLKDGKGGLRDLHTLFWIAKYLYPIESIGDLVDRAVLMPGEARQFAKARRFLLTVRCHLHYLAGRAEDRLTFDWQSAIAARMNYRDSGERAGVARFMKHYFLTAKTAGNLTRIFCAALAAEHMGLGSRRPPPSVPPAPGFRLQDERLALAPEVRLAEDPVAIMRLFWLAHERGLDIHPQTLRQVASHLGRLNAVREDPEANRLFMEILTSRKRPDEGLRRMNEAGVLSHFLPDFGRIVAQPQYDMYHVYTVDEHTIRAIGILARIESGELAADHPVSTREFQNLESRRALYAALLLHDVAKGRGGHAQAGEYIARRLGPRLGLTGAETETVAWLVRHHLVMSETAFRRDMGEAKTIEDFVALVQSPERLRLLLIMTVADIRAVGPSVWNGWKASLLRELFALALARLTGGLDLVAQASVGEAWRPDTIAQLREELADFSEAEFSDHLAKAPPAFWQGIARPTHGRYARLMRQADAAGRACEVALQVDAARGATEILVYADDRVGLFSDIAGAMALAGANIVDARIFTTAHGRALDSFWVQDEWGRPYEAPDRLAALQRSLRIAAESGLGDTVIAARRFRTTRSRSFAVPVRVLLDNEASLAFTVIEINARDRPGLLFAITRAMRELRLQIMSAKVSTYGEQVVDVFYVRDEAGHKLRHERRLQRVREELLRALKEEEAPASVEGGVRVSLRPPS